MTKIIPVNIIHAILGFEDPQNSHASVERLRTIAFDLKDRMGAHPFTFGEINTQLIDDLETFATQALRGHEVWLATKIMAVCMWHTAKYLNDTDEMGFWWNEFYH